MSSDNKLDILFEILSSEQLTLQRTDQKAFTLLSIIGVFAVFFIVHYTKIPPDVFNLSLIFLYFVSVFLSIFFLLLVIVPRLTAKKFETENNEISAAPIYFGGIVKYKSPKEYSEELRKVLDNSDFSHDAFMQSIYSIGIINASKNKYFKKGIVFFVIAITVELIVIVTLYARLAFM
jgi:ABC-type multidrug transport system permease subunit